MSYRVVWFKRDLRIEDHLPLLEAARHGPVLCLYVIEPSLWAQPDAAAQHYGFIRECLHDLHERLQALGSGLHLACGEVVEVFARLHARLPFDAIHAHEETGNAHTYARDRAVARWCRDNRVGWHEWPQFGVTRALKDRNHWQRLWEQQMSAVQLPAPLQLEAPSVRFDAARVGLDSPPAPKDCPQFAQELLWTLPQRPMPLAHELGLDSFEPPRRQRGGRRRGLAVLHNFLNERSAQYRGGISSPLSAPNACSRLSPYLAYGCLSMREVVQATRRRLHELPESAKRERLGLQGFTSRLYWHCHFIQKLEHEPAVESRNMHRGYDGLRENDWNQAHFEALTEGRTGWPMVDACVAMLRETGWLNFRMRAMLVSVAAYPLWLHWHPVGHWLARQFLDYEPGIHWPQLQMQSGTTGINTTRVYNPIKQAMDHDPKGLFVRRWLPALRRIPDSWLFEPWRMDEQLQARYGVTVGKEIPVPPVELSDALRKAKARVHALRRQPEVRAAKASVLERHGSRKNMPGSSRDSTGEERPAKPRAGKQANQLSLDF